MSEKERRFRRKLFQVVRELNVSQDRVVKFVEDRGYADALSGSGLNTKITDEEAYLMLRKEFGDDDEAARRLRELTEDQAEKESASTTEENDSSDEGSKSDSQGEVQKLLQEAVEAASEITDVPADGNATEGTESPPSLSAVSSDEAPKDTGDLSGNGSGDGRSSKVSEATSGERAVQDSGEQKKTTDLRTA
jgi:translation initiation factor IF-2